MENNENIPQEITPQEPPVVAEPLEEIPAVEAPATEEVLPETQYTEPELEEPKYVPPTPKKKGRGKKVLRVLLASVLIIALVAGSCFLTAVSVTNYWEYQTRQIVAYMQHELAYLQQQIKDNSYTGNGNSVSGTPTPVEGLTPGQIYAQNKNSVVGISNQSVTNIFGQVTESASSGSGFIVSQDGFIVTNYHVIENAKSLTVIMNNKDEYPATVVGYHEGNDFALIKIDVTGLTPVTLGNSDQLIVGDQVAAIGNPLGQMTNSLTVGYISVKDRDVAIDNSIINMLQTDAAINPGNSGGPLFNMKGEVIGITTAKSTGNAVEGIGLAIPINDVKQMITELIESGHISAPYMGVEVTNERDGMGVYVSKVEADSPAAKAGLQKGDIILAIGDYETISLAAMDKALRNFEPGDTAVIQVYRSRQVLELTITFGSKYPAA